VNQPVGDMRAIEIAGVDMVHPGIHGRAQHGHGRIVIPGRAEHARPGELHGAIAKAPYGAIAKREGSGLVDAGHARSPYLI
jgi:hypothetical protein